MVSCNLVKEIAISTYKIDSVNWYELCKKGNTDNFDVSGLKDRKNHKFLF